MKILFLVPVLFIGFSSCLLAQTSGDWPIWRGPNGNGVAEAGQTPPMEFSEDNNVIWKSTVPGRGHSSPTIKGDKLFLTTADEDKTTQSVLCYNVDTGEKLWQTLISKGNFPRIHKKNTHASQSVLCIGGFIFTNFETTEGIYLVSLDEDGALRWKINTGQFKSSRDFGYGSTAVIAGDLVVVLVDGRDQGFLAAYDQKTGEEKWRTLRKGNARSSYSAPILGTINGQQQILVAGNGRLAGYLPSDGTELWTVDGGAHLIANTPLWKDGVVFSSGGYPEKETWAYDVANKKILWSDKVKCYEQSLLIVDDYLYGVAEGGIMHCWGLMTGELKWRARTVDGAESASPILAGGHIYHANEKGDIIVIKPNQEKLEIVQQNKLGDEIFATPTFVRNRIFIRSASYSGNERTETLYCIGK